MPGTSRTSPSYPLLSKSKLRVHRTALDNLIGNLRGEIGEVVTSWTILNGLQARSRKQCSDNTVADMSDPELVAMRILCGKLEDDIVARLSELAEAKVGQLTFHFASVKLNKLSDEVADFQGFIRSHGFEEKRNLDISHKVLPETFDQHRHRHIEYRTILSGIARALRLIKRIDREVLGPSAPFLWREARRKRYTPMLPPKAGYLILSYYRLDEAVRGQIIQAELDEGRPVLSEMNTLVNGKPARVLVAREWGGIVLGTRLILLSEYPLQELRRIDIPSDGT